MEKNYEGNAALRGTVRGLGERSISLVMRINSGINSFSDQLWNYFHKIQSQMNTEVTCHYFEDDGRFPNNPNLPVIIYRAFLDLTNESDPASIEKLLKSNGWENAWRDGIYEYHHYHSTAHEVLAVYSGAVSLQLGGQGGNIIALEKGDVVVIPAGVAHKNVFSTRDFRCMGAYPKGQNYDINYGHREERPHTDENIRNVPLPKKDPLTGKDGPLVCYWKVAMEPDVV